MKRLIPALIFILISLTLLSETPNKMSFQAVVRDKNNNLVSNTKVGVKISILKDSETIYSEIQYPTTNSNGLISLEFGGADGFDAIDWSKGPYFLKNEIDPNGGQNYSISGTSQILSVPYALHAQSASYLVDENNFKLKSTDQGVPSQNWSLFGNSKSNPLKDKLGTTDNSDLLLVTDNAERMRILSNGNINILKSLEIGEDLNVKQNVSLNTKDGETINYGPLTVEKQSPTVLTGKLKVDGITDLNSALNVNNQSPTKLTGTLNVDGKTDLNADLTVNNQSSTKLTGALTVDGITNLNSALNVNKQSPTLLSGTLNVKGNAVLDSNISVSGKSNLNNQVTINAKVSGGDANFDAYPLRVMGSDQGIAVKVNGSRSSSNNFVTFWDDAGVQGRIEGENAQNLLTNPEYIFENAMYAVDLFMTAGETVIATAEEVQAIAEGVSYAASENVCVGAGEGLGLVAVEVVCPPQLSEAVTVASNIVLKTANLALVALNDAKAIAEPTAYNAFKISQLGVTYQSGSADYAEWLKKGNPNEKFFAGDIVGVKSGIISHDTNNANNMMVVSNKPIVLGNMPEQGGEANYEKIAFMGQVPVKVFGAVNEGDYILPSGNNDGFGVAVSPENLKLADCEKIVGIAWSSSSSSQLNYVNVAVGLNANDVARHSIKLEKKIEDQAKEIEELKARFDQMDEALAKLDYNYGTASQSMKTKSAKIDDSNKSTAHEPSITYFKITEEQIEEGIKLAKEKLKESGVDVEKHPFFMRLDSDPQYKKDYEAKIFQAYDKEIQKKIKINSEKGIKTIVE